MGLSDTVLVLDGQGLPCPGGHFSRDLRKRGLWVLGDDEPLAVAHREVKRAQERLGRLSR